MITQEYQQGTDIIKIEMAESLSDAKENNFCEGFYTRCYINGKLTDNYMAMIRFIVDNAKTHNSSLIPAGKSIEKQRKEMLERQQKAILEPLEKMKERSDIPQEVKNKIKEFMEKTNAEGVRVKR